LDMVGSYRRAFGPPAAAAIWHAIPILLLAVGDSSLGPTVLAPQLGKEHL
jgi:hypothetical protein